MSTKFKLTENFLKQYENQEPKWGFDELSRITYLRTYSRIKDDGVQETFFDTIKRCVEGSFTIQMDHCKKSHLPWDAYKAQKSAQKMFQKMWEFKFLPPGRGLWTMGTSIVDKIGSASLCNCGFVSTKDIDKDFAEPFAWAADMLMLGVGIGYDTLGAGKVKVDRSFTPIYQMGDEGSGPYIIEDTREGWVDSIRVLLNSWANSNKNHIGHPDKHFNNLKFDYSKIRPAGSPIKGFGGTASGPDPLKEGHENIRKLLHSYNGKPLDSIGIVDIMNYIGKFVVAGNVRRSAEIAIGNIEDQDFIEMKDYKKYPEELKDRRWMSNNSVFSKSNSDFSSIINNITLNGEPGIILLDNCKHYGRFTDGYLASTHPKFDNVDGVNPCAEQCLRSYELCNLIETFPANHDSPEEYYETLKYAYLYAKSVTLLPTHCEKTNQIMLQNRRIGCSQSGIQQAIKKFGIQKYLTEFCNLGYKAVEHWDLIYSRWLGIPTSIRLTTVKPSGTVSILAGATPGVHCTHSEYYMRTIRIASNNSLLKPLIEAGYKVEDSVNDPSTKVVYFPVKEKNFTKSKYDISLWEQLILVKELQHYWADNSVSCTITFKPEEAKDLQSAIEYMAPYVKTLSFLPLEDHNYEQAPYQTCTKQDYEDYLNRLQKLNIQNTIEAKGERYCTNDTCSI